MSTRKWENIYKNKTKKLKEKRKEERNVACHPLITQMHVLGVWKTNNNHTLKHALIYMKHHHDKQNHHPTLIIHSPSPKVEHFQTK